MLTTRDSISEYANIRKPYANNFQYPSLKFVRITVPRFLVGMHEVELATMTDQTKPHPPASLFRRLAALLYDSLLLLAVFFIATAVLLPFTHGEAIQPGNPLMATYLLFLSFFFYGWFWTHGGQTLGMRAWKLQIRNLRDGPLTWLQVLLRYMTAIPSALLGGAGYLWMLLDRRKLTWHDRYSETTILQLDENPYGRKRKAQ